MTSWKLAKVEHDGISYRVKAFNRIGYISDEEETRCVLILSQNVFNAEQPLYVAIVNFTPEDYRFILPPKTMEDIELKMERILLNSSKGLVSPEAYEMASGVCLACYRLNEVLDA